MTNEEAVIVLKNLINYCYFPSEKEALNKATDELQSAKEPEEQKAPMTNAEWCLNKGIKFADIMLQYRKQKYGGGYNVKRRDTREIIGYFVPPHFTEKDYKDKVLSNYAFELWLDQEHEDYKEPEEILTSEERGYLKQVIAPFREAVTSIKKDNVLTIFYGDYLGVHLPLSFEYRGMEEGKKYTLQELGL